MLVLDSLLRSAKTLLRDLDLDKVDWYQTLVISLIALMFAVVGYIGFFLLGAVFGGLLGGFLWGAGLG